jgi:hypothetical protein
MRHVSVFFHTPTASLLFNSDIKIVTCLIAVALEDFLQNFLETPVGKDGRVAQRPKYMKQLVSTVRF